jgi:hypothetical protein
MQILIPKATNEVVKWRLHRCSHELDAADPERTLDLPYFFLYGENYGIYCTSKANFMQIYVYCAYVLIK